MLLGTERVIQPGSRRALVLLGRVLRLDGVQAAPQQAEQPQPFTLGLAVIYPIGAGFEGQGWKPSTSCEAYVCPVPVF